MYRLPGMEGPSIRPTWATVLTLSTFSWPELTLSAMPCPWPGGEEGCYIIDPSSAQAGILFIADPSPLNDTSRSPCLESQSPSLTWQEDRGLFLTRALDFFRAGARALACR